MSGAEGVLVVNIAVGSLFAVGYAIIAFSNASQRCALWFTASYLVGMVSPISDLLAPMIGAVEVLEWMSYTSFLLATLSISVTFSLYHRRRPPWAPVVAILVLGVVLRAVIWNTQRDTLIYGAAYQLGFTLAAALAVRTVLAVTPRRPLHVGFAAIVGLIAVNFMVKPFLAMTFGSGRTLSDYTATTYALLSQASSGILLLAAGIVLLLIVAQGAIAESQAASEIDPLSGLENRRGFDRQADAAVARAQKTGLPVSVAMFDLDHFKRVNDTFGHAVGDAVIAAFAAQLRQAAPKGAVVGRTGGEEFVMLFESATGQAAWLAAEAIRLGMIRLADGGLPPTTVSGGVAQMRGGESLSNLLRRADHAAYEAKNGGRNHICLAADEAIETGGVQAKRAQIGP